MGGHQQVTHHPFWTHVIVCVYQHTWPALFKVSTLIFLLILILQDCSESEVGGNFGLTLPLNFRINKSVRKRKNKPIDK